MIDLLHQKFGKLKVIEFDKVAVSPCGSKNVKWICLCDCGNKVSVLAQSLKRPAKLATISCGCAREASKVIHNKCSTGTYYSWNAMKSRCLYEKFPSFKRYGGRGITFCKEWALFENFYKDMGDRPVGKTLDRINVDGNYELSNCRWATRKEQANNTSKNNRIEFNGEINNISQWAEKMDMSVASLTKRISKWGLTEALTIKKGCKNEFV